MLPGPGQPFRVLLCRIDPGLYSTDTAARSRGPATGSGPRCRLGSAPRLLAPGEQQLLAGYGLGITDLVAPATTQASEPPREELQAGAAQLAGLVARHQPRFVAVAGVTAYRDGSARKMPGRAAGRDDGATRLWIVPNPSGLNAHWPLAAITAESPPPPRRRPRPRKSQSGSVLSE